jgi:TPR repeat protein
VIELLTSAASAGNMDAVYNLGFLYETGVAAQRNATVAREHYTLASRGGHIEARASLGYLNLVSGQYVEARRELIAAAESGSPAAKYYLGLMYLHGMGLQPDHPLALCYLSECVTSAMEISVDAYAPFVLLDVDDIVCKAHSRLGDMTYSGIGCVRNMALAAEHYRTAAAMGAADAANNLGLMLSSGSGVTQDVQEAMTWYAAAALRGCKFAPYNHAVLLSSMNGDHAVVVQLLRTAAQRGNDDAVVMLEGLGVKDRHLR